MSPNKTRESGTDFDLAIIGGGMHGTILSHILTATGSIDGDRLLVLDAEVDPFASWLRLTAATGMTHLRSPGSHNADLDFHALRSFARVNRAYDAGRFIPPYERPRLDLFNEHCRSVFAEYRLAKYRRIGTAERVLVESDRIIIVSDAGTITCEAALLALGAEDRLNEPEWATRIPEIRHVFDGAYDPGEFLSADSPVIIGGGITAVQLALRWRNARKGKYRDSTATILSPHQERISQFDSDPCYIGPLCLREFDATRDTEHRRETIEAARYPGSIPEDLSGDLASAIGEGSVRYEVGEVLQAETRDEYGYYRLEVAGSGPPRTLRPDVIVPATGFMAAPRAGGIIDDLARNFRLPVDSSGWPIPDRALRWHPRIFVTGRAGESVIGPAAQNIIGAHLAARRLVPFLKKGTVAEEEPWRPLKREITI